MRNEYEVRRADDGAVIGEYLDRYAAERFASTFGALRVEVWRKATRTREAELVAEYGGRAA